MSSFIAKTIFIILAALIIFVTLAMWCCSSAASALHIAWDYDRYHAMADEYTLYVAEGRDERTYVFSVEETMVRASAVILEDIDYLLNLHPGIEYTFKLTRSNELGESGFSNEVTHTIPADYNNSTCFLEALKR